MVFIRAPKMMYLGSKAKVLVTCEEEPVAAEKNNCLLMMFHTEFVLIITAQIF
ncbi:MAG: hypothetical protein PVI75_07425 [Gammaproteobacteria bacterium]|jgi:glutamine amidotransferase PdxT